MTTRTAPAVWGLFGLVLGMALGSGGLAAQGGLLPGPRQDPRPGAPRVLSGDDIGFEVRGMDGATPIVVPMIRRNGEWVEAALGTPTIRRLTK